MYMELGLSQKRTRRTAVVSEQDGVESIRWRLDVGCHKKRRIVGKVIEHGVVETCNRISMGKLEARRPLGRTQEWYSNNRQAQEIFLFAGGSMPALGST
jgi:hypothetical protein